MKAVGLYKYLPIDHPESLLDLEVPTPVAAGHDLLVRVKAISVNPVDTKRRAPKDLVEATPKILGWDAARIVGRMPANLPFAESAALPLTTLTAWELMFDRMGISKTGAHAGKSLLILGGAGGVGSIAIQLAKKLARLHVIATASRPESITWCKGLGADETVDHSKPIAGEYDY